LQSISRVGLAVGSGLGVGIRVTVGSGVGEGVGVGVENGKGKPLACGVYAGLPFCVKVIVEVAAREVQLEITRTTASKPNNLVIVMETPNLPLVFFLYPSGDIKRCEFKGF
jgi:hypothetical protein